MAKIKLTEEEIESMTLSDVAFRVLTENGKKLKIQDLFLKVIDLKKLPESYFESKIGDFFGLLSTDKRFIMLDKGYWDLIDNHSKKVVIEDDDDEEEIVEDTEAEEVVETEDDEINYDEQVEDDDDDEDDLKDLVIMDDGEESDMM